MIAVGQIYLVMFHELKIKGVSAFPCKLSKVPVVSFMIYELWHETKDNPKMFSVAELKRHNKWRDIIL